MMFWGRERLAEMYYENAVAEMRKPKPNRTIALWNLNAATNLNPKFLEAINMKQELTGKQITASDNSTARAFVKRAMLRDATPATPPRAGAIRIDPVPTTNPAAVAEATQEQDAPTTAPALAVGELCETATTQPSESAAGVELAGTPTTAPGAETALTQEQDSGFGWSDLAKAMASGPTTAPTSRPAGSEFSGDETAVTEVPMQELPDLSDLPTSDLPAQEPEAPAANK
jgi:hypothetical protein